MSALNHNTMARCTRLSFVCFDYRVGKIGRLRASLLRPLIFGNISTHTVHAQHYATAPAHVAHYAPAPVAHHYAAAPIAHHYAAAPGAAHYAAEPIAAHYGDYSDSYDQQYYEPQHAYSHY